MPRRNISRTMQSFLLMLAEQMRHYAVLRLFNGLEAGLNGRLCLDAQVPLLEPDNEQEYACSLVVYASWRDGQVYRHQLLNFESHYDPGAVMALGPARWEQTGDTLAYQLVSQVVQWKQARDNVTFSYLLATSGLKPDRQRFYL